MPSLSTETAVALLDAIDEACLVVDRDGRVYAANLAARRLLGLDAESGALADLLEPDHDATPSITEALRSSGSTPATLHPRNGPPLRARLSPVRIGATHRPELVLVRLERRSAANRRLIKLTQRIERANRDRRRLRARNEALRHEVENVMPQLLRMSLTDALTGLANKRCFDREFGHEWERATRAGSQLGLLIVDVDHFKRFNDHYGHQAGDRCLKDIAVLLDAACARESDRVCRVGGEEFAVLAPATDLAGCAKMAERVLRAVRDADIPHAQSPEGHVTVSVGFGSISPGKGSASEMFYADVDRALYEAKSGGRNCAQPVIDTAGPVESAVEGSSAAQLV